jgi:hypothetical protein
VWVRKNESILRSKIAEEKFQWWIENRYDSKIHTSSSREQFVALLLLHDVAFYLGGDLILANYVDRGDKLLGPNHSFLVDVKPDGTVNNVQVVGLSALW